MDEKADEEENKVQVEIDCVLDEKDDNDALSLLLVEILQKSLLLLLLKMHLCVADTGVGCQTVLDHSLIGSLQHLSSLPFKEQREAEGFTFISVCP